MKRTAIVSKSIMSKLFLDTFNIFPGPRINPHQLTFFNKGRNLHLITGFKGYRLCAAGSSIALGQINVNARVTVSFELE